ncbi:hypothetical protein Lepto7376_3981 [[Leptolyngbya] sp. PCC 7376]|uniref:hypothetical protein n=1 Tax=[Leptolyngbya] sp. PCC 7376 TaxID=111781 RepID=UPI00029ED0CD|nr:hypothetical protein [[Leptolyngbya] sp. PCC 7376]AFY40121.1 hypothetical protein Lepto7376_3981 [[Leptolyngbya] sp. PCC 7376]
MRNSYEALCGKVADKLDEIEFQVIVGGRYLMAEAYYLGTHVVIEVGDQVLVLGTKGAKVLIAPFYEDAFLT